MEFALVVGLLAATFVWGMVAGERLTMRRIKSQCANGKIAMYITHEGAWKRVG